VTLAYHDSIRESGGTAPLIPNLDSKTAAMGKLDTPATLTQHLLSRRVGVLHIYLAAM